MERRTKFLKTQPQKPHQKYIPLFHLYDILEQIKLIYSGMIKDKSSGCFWKMEQGLTEKVHEGHFKSNGNVPYLGRDLDCIHLSKLIK